MQKLVEFGNKDDVGSYWRDFEEFCVNQAVLTGDVHRDVDAADDPGDLQSR